MSEKISDDRLENAETRDPAIKTIMQNAGAAQAQHYSPKTDEERALDKRVNRKLDWIVLSLLAVEFIVGLPCCLLVLSQRNLLTEVEFLALGGGYVLTRD